MLQLRLIYLEWLLQVRTLRFRIGVLLYLLFGLLPALLLYFGIRPNGGYHFGAGSYATATLDAQRYLTVLLAILVAGSRSDLEGWSRAVPVFGSSPLSNAAVFLRRWLALAALTTLVSILPLALVFLFVRGMNLAGVDPSSWVGRWLVYVLPIAVLVTMVWLAMTTILGTELGALMSTGLLLGLSDYIGDRLGHYLGLPLQVDLSWLGFTDLQYLYWRFHYAFTKRRLYDWQALLLDTDAPFDPITLSRVMAPRWALAGGLTAAVFALGMAFLRRNRRDLRPFANQEEHALRTFLRHVHRLRHRYSPDAALRWERLALVVGLLLLAASTALLANYHQRYVDLFHERYRAETELQERAVTAPSVRIASWKGEGTLGNDGSMRSRLEGLLVNEGDEPISRVAWTSNPFLEIRISAEGRDVRIEDRAWERWWSSFDPPLEPGGELELELRIEGRPQWPQFELGRRAPRGSFVSQYRALSSGGKRIENNPLAFSEPDPAISAHQVLLGPGNLLPLLRYETWELTPPPSLEGEIGLAVRQETFHPVADLALEIRLPADRTVVDSCGNFSREGILDIDCSTAPGRFWVRGGRLRLVETNGNASLLAFPGHEELAEPHFEALRLVTELADRAWPGLEGVGNIVGFEVPGKRIRVGWSSGYSILVYGNMIAIPEWWILSQDTLTVEAIANDMLASRLLERRRLVPRHASTIEAFVATLMAQRMGVGRPGGATITGVAWDRLSAATPILKASRTERYVFEQKVPALVIDMASRIGADRLQEAVESFLAEDGDDPGTIEELLAEVAAVADFDILAHYEHYFYEMGYPELRFGGVEVTPSPAGGYRVVGRLENRNTGRASCPVIVRSEHQQKVQRVEVEGRSETEFVFELAEAPHTLLLDPDKTCFRWVDLASDRVERIPLKVGP